MRKEAKTQEHEHFHTICGGCRSESLCGCAAGELVTPTFKTCAECLRNRVDSKRYLSPAGVVGGVTVYELRPTFITCAGCGVKGDCVCSPDQTERTSTALLTNDETLTVMAACLTVLGRQQTAPADEEEAVNFEQLRSATAKLAQGIGMSLEQLAEFATYAAAGAPGAGMVEFFMERDAAEKRRAEERGS